jgi:hypothetical protein
MLKDIGFLCIAGMIIYDALTGRVSDGWGKRYSRREHPIIFWVMTPIEICVAAFLLLLALYDFYRRLST